jgi:hypothetical protein
LVRGLATVLFGMIALARPRVMTLVMLVLSLREKKNDQYNESRSV